MRLPAITVWLLALLACADALALHIGQLTTTSRLGEPLAARVELYGVGAAEAAALSFELKPDITLAHGSAERHAVAAIDATVRTSGDGTPYVALSSAAAIEQPLVRFRLRARAAGTTTIARLVLALEPPPASPAARPAPATSASRAASPPAVAEPGRTTRYGPVRSGQTLWRILDELGLTGADTGALDTGALIEEVVAHNPHAFVDGDANRLRVGVTLDVPVSRASAPHAAASPARALCTADQLK